MYARYLKLALVTIFTALLMLGGAVSHAADALRIAGLFAVTGPNANFGITYSDGLRLAAKEINDRGGIKADGASYLIDLQLADTQGDPARAVSEAQRLLSGGTRVFFCCNLSAEAVPVVRLVTGRGGLIISQNAATAKTLGTPGHELQFKSANNEAGPRGGVKQWVDYVAKTYPNAKTAAVISPSDEAGQIYADTYAESLKNDGLNVLAVERYDHGATDFSTQLTSIKSKGNPDILVVGYSDEAKLIFRQAREFGFTSKFVGTQGVSAESFAPGEDYMIPAVYLGSEQTDPKIKAFTEKLRQFRGGQLDPHSYYSIATYDWLNILAQAIEKAGTVKDLKAVGEKIRGTTYDGIVDYEIDAAGLAHPALQAVRRENGKLSFVTLPAPR